MFGILFATISDSLNLEVRGQGSSPARRRCGCQHWSRWPDNARLVRRTPPLWVLYVREYAVEINRHRFRQLSLSIGRLKHLIQTHLLFLMLHVVMFWTVLIEKAASSAEECVCVKSFMSHSESWEGVLQLHSCIVGLRRVPLWRRAAWTASREDRETDGERICRPASI